MEVKFKFLKLGNIKELIPLMQNFTNNKYSDSVLINRFKNMFNHEYDCLGIYVNKNLVGLCGLWYQTRHYSGKSCEIDHLYILPDYQNKGVGSKLVFWIENYLKKLGYEALELNAYKENTKSHELYKRLGFDHLGFHFVKRLA